MSSLESAVSAVIADLGLPVGRFTPFADLSTEVQTKVTETLRYTERRWNKLGKNPLEEEEYDRLCRKTTGTKSLSCDALDILHDDLGFTSPESWDCWMTHYNPYDWEDLEEFGIAQHFEVLGWNNVSWVSTDMNMIPESDFMDFDQLSLEQQIAAVNLCFLPEIWDGDSLTSRWVDNYSTVSGRVEETTEAPSASPSSSPSSSPSQSPSSSPSSGPTGAPSGLPSDLPSMVPSSIPSDFPSSIPSDVPSMVPSSIPSDVPSSIPSDVPSMVPSDSPTGEPTFGAKFGAKKKESASSGSIEISILDEQESYVQSDYPSSIPSDVPSNIPSDVPSMIPSDIPSMIPSDMPSMVPSSLPSDYPSLVPSSWSEEDSEDPSAGPSLGCKDDTTWTYTNGNGVTRSCVDVGANPERFCALDWAGNVPDTRTISEACALTCGTCLNSTSDSDGEYQGLRRRS